MLELNFHPFPEIVTERLLLRQLTEDDAEALFFLRSDPAVLKYLNKEPAKDLKAVKEFIEAVNEGIDKNDAVLWGIAEHSALELIIGTACFWHIRKEDYRAELGYVLHPAHWRKGIMKEALTAVIKYGFDTMDLHSIDANIAPDNTASASVLKSLGFSREAHFRENFYYQGKFYDTDVYGLVKWY
jgi:[ribosomal protein S5]-alanine N-acetyltransferase